MLHKMILAILNLYVALMPPIKFQLHPTYHLEADIAYHLGAGGLKIFKNVAIYDSIMKLL